MAPTVSINGPAAFNLSIGRTLHLSVSVTGNPEPVVTWQSSDTDVATVSATGVVTALDEGAATITATATNDEGTDDDTVTVTGRVATPATGDMGARVGITIGI